MIKFCTCGGIWLNRMCTKLCFGINQCKCGGPLTYPNLHELLCVVKE